MMGLEELTKLLLVSDKLLVSNDLSDKIWTLASECNFKINYADITKAVFVIWQSEDTLIVDNCIQEIFDIINLNSPGKYDEHEVEKYNEFMIKYRSHIELEITRCNTYFNGFRNDIDRAKKQTEKLVKERNEFVEEVKKSGENVNAIKVQYETITNEINNNKTQFISILGIFSATILVFFGNLAIIGNISAVFSDTNIMKILMFTSAVGFISYNIVVAFLNFIGKFVYVHKDGNREPIQVDCKYVKYINIIFIAIMIIGTIVSTITIYTHK